MADLVPLLEQREGPEADAGRLLRSALDVPEWSPQQWLRAYRALTYRATRRRYRKGRWLAVACTACALALTAMWAFRLGEDTAAERIARPLLAPGNGHAPRPAASAADMPASPPSPLEAGSLPWRRIDVADLGTLEVSSDSGFELRETPDARELRIARGTLRAQVTRQDPERPVVVITPHLRVVVIGTRFDVVSSSTWTAVSVIEGQVRVEAGPAQVVLGPAESIRSDDPRLAPAPSFPAAPARKMRRAPARRDAPPADEAPAAPLATVAACNQAETLAERKSCLETVARGDGVAAQNALYTLGLLARTVGSEPLRALEHWDEYARRFPQGFLAPEVALARYDALHRLGRLEEAMETALAFERAWPGDPRAPSLALARARLLCREQRREEAMHVLDALAAHPRPRVRAKAVDLRRACSGADLDLGSQFNFEPTLYRSGRPPVD